MVSALHVLDPQLIPTRMWDALDRYLNDRIEPGHFLTAVLSNDLLEAVNRADDENLGAIAAYVYVLYNFAPGNAWGSPEKVRAWLARDVGRVSSRFDLRARALPA